MTDSVMPAGEDATHAHYVWTTGWLVSFNKHTREWSKQRIPHHTNIAPLATEPNRELAPEVSHD